MYALTQIWSGNETSAMDECEYGHCASKYELSMQAYVHTVPGYFICKYMRACVPGVHAWHACMPFVCAVCVKVCMRLFAPVFAHVCERS